MLEHAKKPSTEYCRLSFRGPAVNRDKAVAALRKLGYEAEDKAVDWRALFPEFSGEPEYSVALRGARRKEGMTQVELAKAAGIPQRHISEMEHGKREIGKDRARRLAEALNVDYRIFL